MHSSDTKIAPAIVFLMPRTEHHDALEDALDTIDEIGKPTDERGRFRKLTNAERVKLLYARQRKAVALFCIARLPPPVPLGEVASVEVAVEADGVRHAVCFPEGH